MVRLKHRYLLVNILYPETAATKPPGSSSAQHTPDIIQFNQPTSDKLNPQLLARIIRDGVGELFGDYGSGMAAGGLVGKFYHSSYRVYQTVLLGSELLTFFILLSEISLTLYKYGYHSR